ncbi:uncharacterized protein LOC144428037 [Styela clava]
MSQQPNTVCNFLRVIIRHLKMKRSHDANKNILLLQAIERHSEIYDVCNPAYMDRNVQMLIWKTVAEEVNETMDNCKETWKKLRTALMKNLRDQPPSGSGTIAKKPYYLHEYMGFVMPHLKSRAQRENLDLEVIECPDYETAENESSDQSFEGSSLSASDIVQEGDAREKRRLVKRVPVESKASNIDKAIISYLKAREDWKGITPINFLISILPDMKSFDKEKKLKFKKRILELITENVEDSDSDCIPILQVDCD